MIQRCPNCGAPMSPQPDARVYTCPYCDAQVQAAIEAAQLAAGLHLDASDADRFLDRLARALQRALPERLRVLRDSERVQLLELTLEPDVFAVRREPHGVVAEHRKRVRGITLKTTPHPLDRWTRLLLSALSRHANTSAQVAAALRQLRLE